MVITLLCLAAGGPKAQAVNPAPDGGYPGGNTAEGTNALLSRTAGIYNTAVGIYSLLSLTDGDFCTGVGAGTLLANTGDSNTATGAGALLSNVTGTDNTADGAFALFSNTATGNTAIGSRALLNNTTGGGNTAVGYLTLNVNVAGTNNTANGYLSLLHNLGNNNTAVGVGALESNTSGTRNTALGAFSGAALTTGDNNIDIGNGVEGVAGESNTIRIGNTDITATHITGINGVTVSGGVPVYINSNDRLGTVTSSARFKEEITPMGTASEVILALKPVSFRYKKQIDPERIPQFGLVAEEVEKVNRDLVVRDEKGKPYSVRYDAVNAMLLNEFLKARRRMDEQEATIAQLKLNDAQQQKTFQATVAQLTERLDKQAAQIQKVSARSEISKFARRSAGQIRGGRPAPQMACLPAVAQREGGNNP